MSGKIRGHQGSSSSSKNLWIEPLSYLSTMRVLNAFLKKKKKKGRDGSKRPDGDGGHVWMESKKTQESEKQNGGEITAPG